MSRALLAIVGLASAAAWSEAAQLSVSATRSVATPEVTLSSSFSGRQIFLAGRLPRGADTALAAMEGSPELVRLSKKGRLGPVWMAVRQYEISHVPDLHLVNLHCLVCNGLGECEHQEQAEALAEALGRLGIRFGRGAISDRASVRVIDGQPEEGERQEVAAGFWTLQHKRGLYGVDRNAIRITPDGLLYHSFEVPDAAPEGRYRIITHFLRGDELVAVARNDVNVRQFGFVNRVGRLAERRALAYGGATVGVALAAGFLAGAILRRGARH
jgi:hypothetical protein